LVTGTGGGAVFGTLVLGALSSTELPKPELLVAIMESDSEVTMKSTADIVVDPAGACCWPGMVTGTGGGAVFGTLVLGALSSTELPKPELLVAIMESDSEVTMKST